MGFFSKIKENLSHGGVSVSLTAPASVSVNDAVLPVQVSIANTDQPRTIKSITAEIIANSRDSTFDIATNDTRDRMASSNYTVDKVMAQTSESEPFQIGSGETKVITINITLNPAVNQPTNGVLGSVVGVIAKVNSFGALVNQSHLSYAVRVTADVEGIALDPTDKQPLQLL